MQNQNQNKKLRYSRNFFTEQKFLNIIPLSYRKDSFVVEPVSWYRPFNKFIFKAKDEFMRETKLRKNAFSLQTTYLQGYAAAAL